MSTATRITIAEYDRMIAAGMFEGDPRPRIELIDGELRPMSPIGPVHEDIVDAVNEWSMTHFPRESVRVRIQNSIGIPELDCAPEPDVVLVKRKSYRSGRPLPGDILLVVEVADSSLDYDTGKKADLFAAAHIADYWVINIPGRCIEVFRSPEEGSYHSHEIVKAPSEVQSLAYPQVSLPASLLFPSE
ncbi:MAG TPA: Uma2 family endonuclease [Planctomycetaceae bacterium]|jgi:Uma2 family endonuclease